MTPTGYDVDGESEFVCRKCDAGEKVVRARKRNETNEIPSPATLAAIDIVMNRVLVSERQSAEWVSGHLKSHFAD